MKDSNLVRSSLKRLALAASLGLIPMAFTARFSHGRAPSKGIKCTLTKIQDSQRSSLIAYTYLLPDGWKASNSLNWTGNTYAADFSRMTPDRHYAVDTLEPKNMSYRATSGGQPEGFRMTKAADFLHALADQLGQRGNVTGLQTVEENSEDLPLDRTQTLLQGGRQIPSYKTSYFHQSAFLKISFQMDGVPEVASMGTTVTGNMGLNHVPMGFGQRQTFFDTETDLYVVGPTLVVITPANPSPAKLKEARLIASSTAMTPQFATFCLSLAMHMSVDALNATRERGKQLIANMREQSEKNLENFKRQMADKDATTNDFCNYISGQQDFKQSNGSIVTVPDNFTHVWADDQGHYVLTDSPTDDPKGTLNTGTWEQMSKAQHGR